MQSWQERYKCTVERKVLNGEDNSSYKYIAMAVRAHTHELSMTLTYDSASDGAF